MSSVECYRDECILLMLLAALAMKFDLFVENMNRVLPSGCFVGV